MLVLCCLSSAWSISSTSQVLAPIPDAGDEGEVLLSHPLEKLELLVRYAVMQTPGLKKKGQDPYNLLLYATRKQTPTISAP